MIGRKGRDNGDDKDKDRQGVEPVEEDRQGGETLPFHPIGGECWTYASADDRNQQQGRMDDSAPHGFFRSAPKPKASA